jgi:hypothetical protein
MSIFIDDEHDQWICTLVSSVLTRAEACALGHCYHELVTQDEVSASPVLASLHTKGLLIKSYDERYLDLSSLGRKVCEFLLKTKPSTADTTDPITADSSAYERALEQIRERSRCQVHDEPVPCYSCVVGGK